MTSPDQRGPTHLAVLDMAGTTVRDTGTVEDAITAALDDVGVPPPDGDGLKPLRGLAKPDMFARLCPSAAVARRAHQIFVERMLAAVERGEMVARDRADNLLEGLRRAAIKTCLMTGFDAQIQNALLDRLGWRDLVDLAVTQSDSLRGRPYPDLILASLIQLRVESVRAVLVAGDTTNDLLAGTRAGAGHVLGVTGGAHSRATLATAPHTQIVDSLDDVLATAIA